MDEYSKLPLSEDSWDAWSPEVLANRLKGSDHSWYIVGGWALDLWHGEQTRPHEDLEFAVLSNCVDHFRSLLEELSFFAAKDGKFQALEKDDIIPQDVFQFWGADMIVGQWRVDMMVEKGNEKMWRYKRDASFEMPRSEAIRLTPCGIPYLAPELVLLFKAKHHRAKDDTDFRNALPKLENVAAENLLEWLERFHPNHDWLKAF